MTESQFLSAFLVGLLGGVHCVGMCGGIVGALTMTLPEDYRREPWRMLPLMLGYNAGRLFGYTVAGGLLGGAGYVATRLSGLHQAQMMLAIVAGLFMVALGLYLGGWWFGLSRLEEAVSYYQQALTHKGSVVEVLNALGECYLGLGAEDQALHVWKKSLEIKPGQKEIRSKVVSLKGNDESRDNPVEFD